MDKPTPDPDNQPRAQDVPRPGQRVRYIGPMDVDAIGIYLADWGAGVESGGLAFFPGRGVCSLLHADLEPVPTTAAEIAAELEAHGWLMVPHRPDAEAAW
jgi:hypothetical protein